MPDVQAQILVGAYPNVDLHRLMVIAADRQQPESERIAAIYTLGYTDDHAAEALTSLTPHHG